MQKDINAQVAITTAFTQQAGKAVGDYAQKQMQEAIVKKQQAKDEKDPAIQAALFKEAEDIEGTWGEGKPGRVGLHAIIGALTGNLAGALGAGASQAAIPYIADAIAQLDAPLEVKQALIQMAGTAVGAAVGGASGGTSALTITANNYLKHDEALFKAELTRKLQSCKGSECQLIRDQIALINKTDLWRDQQIDQACKNPSSAECGTWNKDLQIALASYSDKDLTAMGMRSAANKVTSLSDLYQNRINNPVAYGVATGLLKATIGLAAGPVVLTTLGLQALAGNTQAQDQLAQVVNTVVSTLNDLPGAVKAKLAEADAADAAGNPAQAAAIRTQLIMDGAFGATGALALGRATVGMTANTLLGIATKAPSLVTGVYADAAKTFTFTGQMLPSLTMIARNDGQLGEQVAAQLMKEASGGKNFVSIQNNSGNGIDLVYIDQSTKTIYHVEVKTNQIGGTGGIPEATLGTLDARFKNWVTEAAGVYANNTQIKQGTIAGKAVTAEAQQLARTIQQAQNNGYTVSNNLMQVVVPRTGQSGQVAATLRPWN